MIVSVAEVWLPPSEGIDDSVANERIEALIVLHAVHVVLLGHDLEVKRGQEHGHGRVLENHAGHLGR